MLHKVVGTTVCHCWRRLHKELPQEILEMEEPSSSVVHQFEIGKSSSRGSTFISLLFDTCINNQLHKTVAQSCVVLSMKILVLTQLSALDRWKGTWLPSTGKSVWGEYLHNVETKLDC